MNPRSKFIPTSVEPAATLLARIRAELSADFAPGRPTRISYAPGRLDVMGGIADYTGSLVCEATIDRAACVALQEREDRDVQVFSFNLFDEHRPFTFRIPLDSLVMSSIDVLKKEFDEPGRKFAAYIAGCLFILHEQGLIDLSDAKHKGLNLALLSSVPMGAGVSSSAAIEVATMMNLRDHFGLTDKIDGLKLAELCQQVENRVVGAPCGIMDQVTSCLGQPHSLLRMLCQPHEVQPSLKLPHGVRVIGINSNVKHSVGGGMYGRTRCAAFMGHRMILEKMAQMGRAARRQLLADPMHGYLANLDPDDYKKFFRSFLPEKMKGSDFLAQFGSTIDRVTKVDPDLDYHAQGATDHHVLEAMRVRNFAKFMEEASALSISTAECGRLLDKAGHLMYASHLSYTNDAKLGADECDLLVDLARMREPAGIYGAKITGGGSGGTVAILLNEGPRADAAIAEIMAEYQKQTGIQPEAFTGTSPGAMAVGTQLIQ